MVGANGWIHKAKVDTDPAEGSSAMRKNEIMSLTATGRGLEDITSAT